MSLLKHNDIHWILASGSPRRQHLFQQLGLAFSVISSQIDEQIQVDELPRDFAQRMAIEKALDVASKLQADSTLSTSLTSNKSTFFIVGGDTVVALDNQALGKPHDAQHATQMLSELSGKTHDVWSGWAVVKVSTVKTSATQQPTQQSTVVCAGVSRGIVQMRETTAEEREQYVQTGEPLDKAGSYGIQGEGGRLVESLQGSLYGVIGIPIYDLAEALIEHQLLPHPDFARRGILLREQVATAAWRSGRSIDEVQVLAVSKRNPTSQLLIAGAHQFYHFGESYLQELTTKQPETHHQWSSLITILPQLDPQPTWHYIGKIQTNKAKQIGSQVTWVHGVSRLSEARRLAEGAQQAGHKLRIFLQVNIAGEDQKAGVDPDQVADLLEGCQTLNALEVVGLMTFPPLSSAEESRVHFRALRMLRDQLASPETPLTHLSMGTSHDFEVAIEEGATWVRLGRSLFGERD